MLERPHIEAVGDHRYLARVRQSEDIVEIRVRATPSVIARLTNDESDETRIVQATVAYLITRQRADDLPAELDLDDVAAAYEGFEDHLRRGLTDSAADPDPT